MQDRPLSIYYVGGPGAHAWALQPMQALQRRGHRVRLLCPEGSPAATAARAAGVPQHSIVLPHSLRDLPGIVRCINSLRSTFRSERPDVVQHFMLPVSLWSRLAARSAGVPVRLYKPPSLWELGLPLYRLVEFATAWMDSAVLASSRALAAAYRKFPLVRERVTLSYYGLALDPFDPARGGSAVRQELGLAPDDLVIGLVAYMIPPVPHIHREIGIKGHEVLLRAARSVAGTNPSARFLIAGDEPDRPGRGAYRRQLEALARELGLERQVIFAGQRNDIPAVLAAIDVAVVPSLSENVGGAVEPLLMEKPVVASRVGGLPDVVHDGETGLLVPPGDPEALAAALLRLLAMPPGERRRMGRRGREIVCELFDLERVVDREIALCRTLLAQHQGRAHGGR